MDQRLNGDVIYYFYQNTSASGESEDEQTFKIDSTTGQITLLKNLDRESVSQYLLTVIARDAAELNPLSSSTLVTIEILDGKLIITIIVEIFNLSV